MLSGKKPHHAYVFCCIQTCLGLYVDKCCNQLNFCCFRMLQKKPRPGRFVLRGAGLLCCVAVILLPG
nr:MAG TPA: hypothetical protein [Caudoviricetes sp.]